MPSTYWNFSTPLVPGTLAKAEEVNTLFTAIDAALALIEIDNNRSIQVTNSPGTTAISLNAAARASKLLAFDASGNVVADTLIGSWKGDHADAAGTDYAARDIVRDAAGAIGLNNLYICQTAHTSTGGIDVDIANWSLLIDVADVTAQAVLATAAAAAAEAAYDSFDDRYLGAKASDPALDNDGDALIDGALYWNTTTNEMLVYDLGGATWVSWTSSVFSTTVEFGASYNEVATSYGTTGAIALDTSAAAMFYPTGAATGTITFTFTNPPAAGKVRSFTLEMNSAGSQTINWPASVDWDGGAAPALSASGIDVLTFYTRDGGTTWYGFAAGYGMA